MVKYTLSALPEENLRLAGAAGLASLCDGFMAMADILNLL